MKFKKLLAMALVASFALSNVVTVSATEMSIAEDSSQTGTVPSGFNVDEDTIGAGVVVRVPANLDLAYDSQMDAFRVVDTVGAKGTIRDWYAVTVSVDDSLTYSLADSDETVEARVRFGENTNGVGTEVWDSADVALGATDDAQMDCRSLIIDISSMDIANIGDYSATAEFNIKLAPIGMYSEITTPITDPSLIGLGNSSQGGKTYVSFSGARVPSVNLAGLSEDYKGAEYTNSNTTPNTVVKYIELNPSFVFYSKINDLTDVNSVYNWAMNMEALSLVVVPEGITTANLKSTHDTYSMGTPITYDYHDTVFTNTNTVIGDALAFCKGIDDNGLYIYVPHIVYRGTTAEWQALSGHDDWVFGNAANVVKVHCTDGILTY